MSTEYSDKVLFVDDDVNLLAAVNRQMRGKFKISTAVGGVEAFGKLEVEGPFAVVVSDMRMPDMNGIQFLAKVHERYPDAVRIMLTGHADIDVATHAVNETNIFRFLVKPCHKDIMEWAIEAAIEQYRLIMAERELLESTLNGSVQVLVDILALVNPLAFSRATRLKKYVRQVVGQLGVDKVWQFELATLLSQIGCIALPADTLAKYYSGEELSADEQNMYVSHPSLGADLLARIPRLEIVSEIIANQLKKFSDYNLPDDCLPSNRSIMGAQILKATLDFDTLISRGVPGPRAIADLKRREGDYHPIILDLLKDIEVVDVERETKVVKIYDLNSSMILADDVRTRGGVLIAAKGQEVSLSMRTMFRTFFDRKEIEERIRVFVPKTSVKEESGKSVPTQV
jgi:response regulator RpfG family c-di-GMP phosphodiesterase